MKKNQIFTFTAPNGAEVTAVVIGDIFQNCAQRCFICYAQNRIFTYIEERWRKDETTNKWLKDYSYGETLVDYCVLPEYDAMLEAEQQKFKDMTALALIYWPNTQNYTVWQYNDSYESYEEWENRVKNNEIYKANHCRIQIIQGTLKDV